MAAGDPITIKIELSGEGNFGTLDFPSLNLGADFKVYPPTIKSQAADDIGLQGSKVFEFVVVPQSPDLRQIPAFEFSFFDPAKKAYRTLKQEPIAIVVRPGGSAAPPPTLAGSETKKTEQSQDIANIKLRPGKLGPAARPVATENWFLALQLLPLLGLGAALTRLLVQRHKERNPRWVRQREVGRWVDKTLGELQAQAAAGDSEQFHATVFRVLQEQLGERLGTPAQAITEAVVAESLLPRGLNETTASRLQTLFARCDQARYAQGSTPADLNDTLAELTAAIQELRQFTPQKASPSRMARGLVPLLALVLWTCAAQGADDFEQGNTAYAEGKLNSAINHYEALIKANQVSPALYFNLGNAYFKMGHLGQAIAYYRKAQELAPRDSDIANNLQMARAKASANAPFRLPWWQGWTHILSLNEWTWAAMAVGWGLIALLSIRLWLAAPKPGLHRAIRWLAVVFALLGTGFGIRLAEYYGPAPAVIIAKEVSVRYGPLDDARSFYNLPDGAEVQVVDKQGEWLQVRDPQKRSGWLKQGLVLTWR